MRKTEQNGNDSRMVLGKSDMENPSSDGRSTGLAEVSLLHCWLHSGLSISVESKKALL